MGADEQWEIKVVTKDRDLTLKVKDAVVKNFSLYRNNPQYCFGIQAVPDGLEKFHLIYGDSEKWIDLFTRSIVDFVKDHYKTKLKTEVKAGVITFKDNSKEE